MQHQKKPFTPPMHGENLRALPIITNLAAKQSSINILVSQMAVAGRSARSARDYKASVNYQ